MQQAEDFLAESEDLAAVLADLPASDWDRATQFKEWTLNDVIVHLHFWNRAADMSLFAPEQFEGLMAEVMAGMAKGGMRSVENAWITARGPDLYSEWAAHFREMAERWTKADPKARVKWAGPEMSVRSSITARQMETWAHGQEVFDLLGVEREDTDRIRNIVILGVNTFQWSHKVQGLAVPDAMPELHLTAPSGDLWRFGEAGPAGRIEGSAVEFAQVVTQVRNIADTQLEVHGPVATQWMHTAQCFAGGKETPPPPGTRHLVKG